MWMKEGNFKLKVSNQRVKCELFIISKLSLFYSLSRWIIISISTKFNGLFLEKLSINEVKRELKR